MTLLEVEGLSVRYARRRQPPVQAVSAVDLALDRGEIVGLVGESGCGKSTLARAIVGLVAPSEGEVRLHGARVRPLGRGARPRAETRLQMIFQDPYSSLNPRRRVGAQIADGLRLRDDVPAAERGARVAELLDQVGIPASAARRYPHEFSGGQRQRLAIARALAAGPEVIVADEAVAALDASTQAQIANLLVALTRELGVGLLFISHDLAVVRHLADRVAVMYLGQIVETAATAQLWSTPLHPYTEALIAAVPLPDGLGRLPEALAGEVGDPSRPPPGCRFHPRCTYVFDRCSQDRPSLLPVTPGRQAACWLHEPGGAIRSPAAAAGRT